MAFSSFGSSVAPPPIPQMMTPTTSTSAPTNSNGTSLSNVSNGYGAYTPLTPAVYTSDYYSQPPPGYAARPPPRLYWNNQQQHQGNNGQQADGQMGVLRNPPASDGPRPVRFSLQPGKKHTFTKPTPRNPPPPQPSLGGNNGYGTMGMGRGTRFSPPTPLMQQGQGQGQGRGMQQQYGNGLGGTVRVLPDPYSNRSEGEEGKGAGRTFGLLTGSSWAGPGSASKSKPPPPSATKLSMSEFAECCNSENWSESLK